ncbi:hypothetical protein ACTFIZ_007553 [Dictyostelium cf. discoideum]
MKVEPSKVLSNYIDVNKVEPSKVLSNYIDVNFDINIGALKCNYKGTLKCNFYGTLKSFFKSLFRCQKICCVKGLNITTDSIRGPVINAKEQRKDDTILGIP